MAEEDEGRDTVFRRESAVWVCPECKAVNSDSDEICPRCDVPRPGPSRSDPLRQVASLVDSPRTGGESSSALESPTRPQPSRSEPQTSVWTCSCGTRNHSGSVCASCGRRRNPAASSGLGSPRPTPAAPTAQDRAGCLGVLGVTCIIAIVAGASLWFVNRDDRPSFDDVQAGYAYASDIDWAVSQDIVWGFRDDTFRPESPVSRGAAIGMLFRLEDADFEPPPISSLADVPPTDPHFREIEWSLDNGVTPTGDRRFRPDDDLTRGELAGYLYRLAGSPRFDPPSRPTFNDVDQESMSYAPVEWLAAEGIIDGSSGQFKPDRPVSRGAMTAFLHRYADSVGP